MDLENLKQELKDEIRRLDQRQALLKDQMVHLRALELSDERFGEDTTVEAYSTLSSSEGPLLSQKEAEAGDLMLAGLRCLKCGSSLRQLVPKDSSGRPYLNSPRLGRSEGSNRYLECPQCLAKNMFVRTASPLGWKLLVTQLKQ